MFLQVCPFFGEPSRERLLRIQLSKNIKKVDFYSEPMNNMDLLKEWSVRRGRDTSSGEESSTRASQPSQVMSLNASDPAGEVERPGSTPTTVFMTPQGDDTGLEEFTRGLLPDDVDLLIKSLQKVKSDRQEAGGSSRLVPSSSQSTVNLADGSVFKSKLDFDADEKHYGLRPELARSRGSR